MNSLAQATPEDKAQALTGDTPQAVPGNWDPSTHIPLPKSMVVSTRVVHMTTQKATRSIPHMTQPMDSPQAAPGNRDPSTQIPLP